MTSGRQDSNLRSPAPKAGALATTLRPAKRPPDGVREPRPLGADDGNRTRVASLEDWGSTIELHPRARAPPEVTRHGAGAGAMVPTGGPTPTAGRPPDAPQRRWTSTSARSSLLDPSASISRSGAALEAARAALGLAEHPVDAELDVPVAGLDHPVGVEQHRVAGRSRPRTPGTRRPRSGPRPGPRRRPSSGPSRRRGGRPAGGRRCGPRSRRWPGRGRGGRRWRTPRPSPAGAGSRWRRAGTPAGGSAPISRRRRRRAAARGCRRSRPCRRRRPRDLEPGARRAGPRPRSRRRTACRRRSAARTRRTSPLGSGGQRAWLWIRSRRSTSIDSPWMPATPSRLRRNEVSRMMKPAANITDDATTARSGDSAWDATTSSTSTNTTNHGRCAGRGTGCRAASAAPAA